MATLAESSEKYTYHDYAKLPEGSSYQLIDEELIMTPAPTPIHQRVSRRILRMLDDFVETHKLGEVFYFHLLMSIFPKLKHTSQI